MIGEWLAQAPGSIGSFGRWLAASAVTYPLGVVAVVVAAFLFVVLAARASMPRSIAVFVPLAIAGTASTVSPGYYLAFALVIAALVIGSQVNGGSRPGDLDAEAGAGRAVVAWRWLLLAAVALSIVPLPWGGGTLVPGQPGSAWVHSWILRHIAVVWLVVIAAGICVVFADTLWHRARPGMWHPLGYAGRFRGWIATRRGSE